MANKTGNWLDVKPAGIEYCNAAGLLSELVVFRRDGENRMARIIDSDAEPLSYTYDNEVDLIIIFMVVINRNARLLIKEQPRV